MSLCGVILAAGDSTRMGTDKALLPWPRVAPGVAPAGTFLSAAIESLSPFTELIIVVAGKNTPAIAPIVYATSAALLTNPAPGRGQFSSLLMGLQEVLNRGRDAAMVTLVDRPPVGADTIQRLCEAFAAAIARWKWAVVPQHAGKHGHPIVLGREMIEAFLKAAPTSTARDIEHQNVEHIEYVDVDDPLVIANINTPEEYASLASNGVR
ncbi:MAG: nucleotidyltransferase family protein [Terriglobales bacterium]